MKEYLILDDDNISSLEKQMNEVAKQGWQLEQMFQVVGTGYGAFRYTTVIMSREKENK